MLSCCGFLEFRVINFKYVQLFENSLCCSTYSAIIQMLMSFPLSADVRDDVRAASYSLLSCETEGNNYPPVLGIEGYWNKSHSQCF